jgi:hypothetical protein
MVAVAAAATEAFLSAATHVAALATASAAALLVRALVARVEVPHDEVSLRLGLILSKHLFDVLTIYR